MGQFPKLEELPCLAMLGWKWTVGAVHGGVNKCTVRVCRKPVGAGGTPS
jgi:hypothetical protein